MLQKDPKLMQEIIGFVDRFYARNHRSPSIREIEAGTSMKRSSMSQFLSETEEPAAPEPETGLSLEEQIARLERRVALLEANDGAVG